MPELQDLISVETLQAQGFKLVREVHIDEGHDSTGDDAYFIWVLMDDAATSEDLSWKALEPLYQAIFRVAWKFSREKIYPYIRIKRVSEWRVAETA